MNGMDSPMREALRQQESACAHDVPAFASIATRIEAAPSPLEAERWPAATGARLAASLVAAQVRVVPYAVLAAAVVVAAAALAGACLIGMTGVAAVEAAWWFAAFLLVGAAITVTLALSSGRADALALATPLGPQTVALARLAAVLGVDALVGLASSAAFAWWGSIELGFVVVSWLVPLALVAGASAFVAVWSETPWAGAVVGAVLVPLVLPAAQADTAGGAWGLVGVVQGALGPVGLVALGAALLAAAVCSSRRAALARLQVV